MPKFKSASKTPYLFVPPPILCVPDGAIMDGKVISFTNRPQQTFFTIYDENKKVNTKYYPSCPFKRNSTDTGWMSSNPVVISSGKTLVESIAKSISDDQ